MKYKILSSYSENQLARQVMEALGEGWELQGGVSVSVHTDPGGNHYHWYAQALFMSLQTIWHKEDVIKWQKWNEVER